MARLMLSAGMLAARADSVAAFRRRLPLGSPPPFLAATVISRRILEKSLPRCTSVLPFFRLICDHRECPDMAPSPSPLIDGSLSPVPTLPLTQIVGCARLASPRLAHARPDLRLRSARLRLASPRLAH